MNNINRHNYETFFLLYADNELSVAEKNAVDEFVQTNPDLQDELVMLQQSILKPDNIVFTDKKSLLKNEFFPTSVQKKLLSYLDNELTIIERNEINELIKADTAIKMEWNILQQTKLLPGKEIVFENKKSLYRKEAYGLIPFPWWRMAAAAVLIGFGVWGGLIYFNNDAIGGNNEIAKNPPAKATSDTVMLATQQTTTVVLPTANEKEIGAIHGSSKNSLPQTTIQPKRMVTLRKLSGRDIQTIVLKEKDNNLPQPYFDNVNNVGSNKTITAYVKPATQPNTVVEPAGNDFGKITGTQDAANVYASSASYADNSEDNNNRVLFMDEQKIKKTKLGGIFRKVKRVIERSANIKPGSNNIKVANLEFAIQ